MMRQLFLLVALWFGLAACQSDAAIVRFTLLYNHLYRYQVYAEELDGPSDNAGIAAYGLDLDGAATVDHASPRLNIANGPNGTGPAGFTVLRSADGEPSLLAAQDYIAPTPNLIYGLGQHAGSFAKLGMADMTSGLAVESPAWRRRFLIAQGKYAAGIYPSINARNPDTFATVFIQVGGASTRYAAIEVLAYDTFDPLPEPGMTALVLSTLIGVQMGIHRSSLRSI